MAIDTQATAQTRARYQRIAPLYNVMELAAERRYRSWRPRLWSQVRGPMVLEVGVGTGKNMPYYSDSLEVMAVDLTPGMLERAQKRAAQLGVSVDLQLGDVQALGFPDASFDDVVATFVFCSVPDPVLGLQELARVVKPGGRLLLLEHVRSARPLLGMLMDALNPVFVRLSGANINRKTVKNVQQSGWQLEQVEDMGRGDVFKLVIAQRPSDALRPHAKSLQ